MKELINKDQYFLKGKLVDIIQKLQIIVDKNPEAKMEVKNDYTSCYYEGDMPDLRVIIYDE